MLAQQAPSGSMLQLAHFVAVTDPEKRAALADVWRVGSEAYKPAPLLHFRPAYRVPLERITPLGDLVAGRPRGSRGANSSR